MTKRAIIVTGSRHLDDERDIERVTECLVEAFGAGGDLFVGDAAGVDALARHLAEQHGITLHVFKADWDTHGRSAGPRRNAEMVHAFQNFLAANMDYEYRAFAFPAPKSKGTWGCLRMIVDTGIFLSVWGVGRGS